MNVVKLIVALVAGVLLVLFGAQNAQPVSVQFFGWESSDVPLVLALGLALFVGAVLSATLAAPGLLGGWRDRRSLAREVEAHRPAEAPAAAPVPPAVEATDGAGSASA